MSKSPAGPASAGGRIAIQTTALLVDAYRELDAKKLFWITLVLSGLFVGVFAALGLNERGLTVLWWEFPSPLINSTVVPKASFYKMQFAVFGIPVWLTWVAAVLALISTAGIFPDFILGGSIELALSKPISRMRLFLTKYITGLLFVFLQVLVFTLASFLVIGLRGHEWAFALFLAVPIVVCFYSYIFCFCVLMGILTRSTIAAVLLTCLFWITCFLFNAADSILLQQRVIAEIRVDKGEKKVAKAERIAREKYEKQSDTKAPSADKPGAAPAAAEDGAGSPAGEHIKPEPTTADLDSAYPSLAIYRGNLAKDREGLDTWRWWSGLVFRVHSILPKTDETVKLLDRYVLSPEDVARFLPKDGSRDTDSEAEEAIGAPPGEVARRTNEAVQERSLWWVVGTSLGFEAVIVGIGAWIFVRRDF